MQSILFKQVKSISIFLFLIFALSSNSYATNYVWNGINGLWNAPHNWLPYGVPGTGDVATITNGAARVQFGISVSIGRVDIRKSGELRIYPNSTLTVWNNSNGAGIKNDGSLLVYGTLNIQSTPTSNGYGIKNDGSVNLTATSECNITGTENVAIFNNQNFKNYGTLNISDISSHGILNYGLFENRGEVDIEISPEVYTWGIINFLKLYNYKYLRLFSQNSSSDLGGILNTSTGDIQNYNLLSINGINGTGLRNLGSLINKKSNPLARIYISESGNGLELRAGSTFTNEHNSIINLIDPGSKGISLYASAQNDGLIIIEDSKYTDLYIGSSGNLINNGLLRLGFNNTTTLYSIFNKGSLNNLGWVKDSGNTRTQLGSTLINNGSYECLSDSNPFILEDIINYKAFNDNFGNFSNKIINKGIIVEPYAGAVQVDIPVYNFLDIDSSTGMTIESNVYEDDELFGSQIVGSYNSQNNSFIANANGIGLSSVYVRINFNPIVNIETIAHEVKLPSPIFISLNPHNKELSLRNEEESNTSFKIYPVPASQTLFLEHEFSDDFDFVIMNAQGQVIKKGKMSGKQIDIQEMHAGQYFIKARFDDRSYTKKFIKI